MATVALSDTADSAAILPDEVYRLTVEQYHEMAEAGILTTEDRVELVEGVLVKKMTISPLHTFVTEKFSSLMNEFLIDWHSRVQQPITLADSEPEPDGAVVRGKDKDYLLVHPTIERVGIVCEVSDRSLTLDRGRKKRMYARSRVPVYWIANLKERVIEVYSDPDGPDYRRTRNFSLEQSVPVELDGKTVGEISVATLFGK